MLNIVPLGSVDARARRSDPRARAGTRPTPTASASGAGGRRGAEPSTRAAPARAGPLRAQLRAAVREAARLLRIAWEYEPRTFTLERDRDGNPAQAFTPDFYLPAYDLYIEITTLNQKLVTKKNRKARRLRELYPDVQIKVLYQRDYLHLLVKYGLEPPSQLVGRRSATASRCALDLVAAGPRREPRRRVRRAESA